MEITFIDRGDRSDRNYPTKHCSIALCIPESSCVFSHKMASRGSEQENAQQDFIEEVQKYYCLYNKFSKEYKDKFVKINCWSKIGEKFSMSPEDAEKKFKNMRTAYGRYLRKLKKVPSGSGREAVPPREFTNLDWLQPHISSRPTSSNFSVTSPVVEESAEGDEGNDGEPINQDETQDFSTDNTAEVPPERAEQPLDESQETPGNNRNTGEVLENQNQTSSSRKTAKSKGNKGKRPWSNQSKRTTEEEDSVEAALLKSATSIAQHIKQASEAKRLKGEQSECEDSLYCKSLIPRMKRLDARSKAFIRLQIEQLFFQAEASPSPSTGSMAFGCSGGNDYYSSTPQSSSSSSSADYSFQGHSSYLRL